MCSICDMYVCSICGIYVCSICDMYYSSCANGLVSTSYLLYVLYGICVCSDIVNVMCVCVVYVIEQLREWAGTYILFVCAYRDAYNTHTHTHTHTHGRTDRQTESETDRHTCLHECTCPG